MASKRENQEPRSGQLVTKRARDQYPDKEGPTELPRSSPTNLPVVGEKPGLGFFSFRYSFKEVSLSDGKTHIRAKEHRFEDGKFQSEEFEGTMDEGVYQDALRQTQDLVAGQVRSIIGLFNAFLPFSARSKGKQRS